MSNKNSTIEKKKENKLFLQLKKEVNDLEKQIKYSKLNNFKLSLIKNLKISLKIVQLITPYIVTSGIIAGGLKLAGGGMPYYLDNIKVYSHTMSELDNEGNLRTEQKYDSFDNEQNILSYCSKWEHNEDGTFSRKKENYNLSKFSLENINEIFEKDCTELEEIFGPPKTSVIETSNNIDIKELNKSGYIQVIIYDEDKDNFIIAKESTPSNIAISILHLFLTIIAGCCVGGIRKKISKFDFLECISKLKEKYKSPDLDEIVKKLEIKTDNLNRLMR